MPWDEDYLDICNLWLIPSELQQWIRAQKWLVPVGRNDQGCLAGLRVGYKRFRQAELDDLVKRIGRFREIVIRWVTGKPLTEDEKWVVIYEFLRYRSGGVIGPDDGETVYLTPTHPHFKWEGNRLGDLELEELLNLKDSRYIIYHLFRELYDDIQRTKGLVKKPKLCALREERGAEGRILRGCNRLFRPKDPRRKYCSERCRSTASSRRKAKRDRGRYTYEYSLSRINKKFLWG